jgi:hypothetical protein
MIYSLSTIIVTYLDSKTVFTKHLAMNCVISLLVVLTTTNQHLFQLILIHIVSLNKIRSNSAS